MSNSIKAALNDVALLKQQLRTLMDAVKPFVDEIRQSQTPIPQNVAVHCMVSSDTLSVNKNHFRNLAEVYDKIKGEASE